MDPIILVFIAAVVLLGFAAQLWGADSRPSFQDSPVADLTRTV